MVLGCCVGAFISLFLVGALINDVEEFLKHGASAGQMVRYFLYLQPAHLAVILPMSALLASMYTVASLCRHHEFTALSASGVPLTQVVLPILVIALVLSVLQLAINEFGAARFKAAALRVRRNVVDPYGKRARRQDRYLAYRSRAQRRDWLFEDFAAEGVCRQVLVTQFRPDSTVDWELRAETAEHVNGIWVFSGVELARFDAEGLQHLSEPEVHETLRRPDLPERPAAFLYAFRLQPAAGMNIRALLRVLRLRGSALSPATVTVMRTELYRRLFYPAACLVGVLLGAPLAVSRERRSPVRSFVLAAGLMALYHVSSEVLLLMGKAGAVPPLVAGALPSLAFCGWGGWEMVRRR